MLNVGNVIPFVKIFPAAYSSMGQYEKYLNSINFWEVVINLVKGKEIKENNIIRKVSIRKAISDFGLTASTFQ